MSRSEGIIYLNGRGENCTRCRLGVKVCVDADVCRGLRRHASSLLNHNRCQDSAGINHPICCRVSQQLESFTVDEFTGAGKSEAACARKPVSTPWNLNHKKAVSTDGGICGTP